MFQEINKIDVKILSILKPNTIELDDIIFSNINIIQLFIDNKDIREYGEPFYNMLIYYDELVKSINESDKYLIMTCACGVADDGGWEGVYVSVDENIIKWDFEIDSYNYHFSFLKENYLKTIKQLEYDLSKLGNNYPLEPTNVIFPEDW